jgi:GNAT superfamily N-acetyltransferase
MMIRPIRTDDLEALYRIALATGDGGNDAATLYRDPRLVGHIYAAPYAVLCPDTVFVAEDDEGIGGYIVGAADTRAFELRLEAEWWPALRREYSDPSATPRIAWTLDQRRINTIHHPRDTPEVLTRRYPSHLHINLLPRLRGRGIGQALMTAWLDAVRQAGSAGAHLAVGTGSELAIRFYLRCGFQALDDTPPAPGAIWLGRTL